MMVCIHIFSEMVVNSDFRLTRRCTVLLEPLFPQEPPSLLSEFRMSRLLKLSFGKRQGGSFSKESEHIFFNVSSSTFLAVQDSSIGDNVTD